MKKFLTLFCTLLLCAFVMAGCGGNDDADKSTGDGNQPADSQTHEPADGQDQEPAGDLTPVASADGKVQREMPKKWQTYTGQLNQEADIEVGSKDQSKFAMALIEDRTDADVTLQEYNDFIIEYYANDMITDCEPYETQDATVNGCPAKFTQLTGKVEGMKVTYWVYAIETETTYTQAIGWTYQSKGDKNSDEINTVLQTFKEL